MAEDNWWANDQTITPGKPIITKRATAKDKLAERKLGQEVALGDATADAERRTKEANARKAEADAADAEAKSKPTVDPQLKSMERDLQTDEILAAIQRARKLANQSMTTGLGGQVMSNVGGTSARDLKGALNTVAGNVMLTKLAELKANSSQGASGLGALSEREGEILRDSVASIDQFQSPEGLLTNLDNIEAHYRTMLALGNQEDPRDETVKRKYGLAPDVAPPGAGPAAPGVPPSNPNGSYNPGLDAARPGADASGATAEFARGDRREDDPALAGLRSEYSSRLARGDTFQELATYLKGAGVTAPDVLNSVRSQVEFRRNNPRVPIKNYDTRALDDRFVPQTAARQFLNTAAGGDGVVGDVSSGLISAGDAVTGFNLARATDNPNLTRAGIAEVQSRHPVSSALGTVAGGALVGAGSEVALGAAGVRAGAGALSGRLLASDGAYGALSGYGMAGDKASVSDIVKGAGIGLTGGALARGVVGTAATALGPQGAAYGTIGQRAGGAANNVEQALGSVPFLGGWVRGARQEARDQWETEGFNRALKPISEKLPEGTTVGGDAIAYTRKAFDGIYDKARSGMQFIPDSQYAQDFGQFQQSVINGAYALDSEATKQLEKTITTQIGSRIRNGQLSGDAYKSAMSNLRSTISNTSKPELRQALKDYRDLFDQAARRNSAPDAVALMDAADKGYAQFKPIKDAAGMAGSDPGRFTVSALDAVERRGKGKTNAYLEGDTALGDYLTEGRALRETLPNSGTIDRGVALGALTGSYFANPAIPAAALTATLPYAPGVRNVVNAALRPRDTPKLNTLADMLRSRQSTIGYAGAPLLLEQSQ